jgi:uncharacterized protein (TIGR01777 family)
MVDAEACCMKVLVSGGSGLVGTALTESLRSEGHTVAHLVRPGGEAAPGDIRWDPASGFINTNAMEAADAVVNLNGASIGGGRWTPERKKILHASRIAATRLLVDAFTRLKQRPRVFLSASAIGYYGNRGDEVLTESSAAGNDFLATVTRDWEAEALRAQSGGIRTVLARFGIILSAKGGALKQIVPPFKLGLGGRLGSGQQWMSWVAIDDVVGILRAAISDEKASGPVNVVAPNPVRNSEFTHVLAGVLHRPAIFPAPAFGLRLMLGEMADALLLSSQKVRSERLPAATFPFRYENLEPALHAILAKK